MPSSRKKFKVLNGSVCLSTITHQAIKTHISYLILSSTSVQSSPWIVWYLSPGLQCMQHVTRQCIVTDEFRADLYVLGIRRASTYRALIKNTNFYFSQNPVSQNLVFAKNTLSQNSVSQAPVFPKFRFPKLPFSQNYVSQSSVSWIPHFPKSSFKKIPFSQNPVSQNSVSQNFV